MRRGAVLLVNEFLIVLLIKIRYETGIRHVLVPIAVQKIGNESDRKLLGLVENGERESIFWPERFFSFSRQCGSILNFLSFGATKNDWNWMGRTVWPVIGTIWGRSLCDSQPRNFGYGGLIVWTTFNNFYKLPIAFITNHLDSNEHQDMLNVCLVPYLEE